MPARYVAEAFGGSVRWDNVIRTVYIDTNESIEPTPQATKDPVYGWIKVETNIVDVEYGISITFTSDQEILKARFDAAEKMFADECGGDIAKQVFQYLRQKQNRWDELPLKQYKLGNKIVTSEASGISIMLDVWKEGVVFR